VRTDPSGHQLDSCAQGANIYDNIGQTNGGALGTLMFFNAGERLYTMNSTNAYNDPNYPFAVQTANRLTIMKVG